MLATQTSYLYLNHGRRAKSGTQVGYNAFHISNLLCLDLNQKQRLVSHRKRSPAVRNSVAIFPIHCRIRHVQVEEQVAQLGRIVRLVAGLSTRGSCRAEFSTPIVNDMIIA